MAMSPSRLNGTHTASTPDNVLFSNSRTHKTRSERFVLIYCSSQNFETVQDPQDQVLRDGQHHIRVNTFISFT